MIRSLRQLGCYEELFTYLGSSIPGHQTSREIDDIHIFGKNATIRKPVLDNLLRIAEVLVTEVEWNVDGLDDIDSFQNQLFGFAGSAVHG